MLYEVITSIIYPHDSLNILAYNRAVKDLNGNSASDFIEKIKDNFDIAETNSNDKNNGFVPKNPKEIGMYLESKWYLLKPKKNVLDNIKDNLPVSELDVSILQNFLLSYNFV